MRKHLLASTIFTTAIAFGAPALAQTAAGPGRRRPGRHDPGRGSRRHGLAHPPRPTNAPTPLIQVSQDQLLTTGQSTVIDYLATIPALSNSVVPSDTTGSGLGDGGLSLPNLRSLGSNRTLTLVDGRRHVGSSGGSLSVDIDTIPRLLIENIEIVTGGAASVYGADAVSGVLNFILKKDFEGLEIDANYGQINQDGQANRRISALIGKNFFDDRLNVYAHAEYEKIDEVTLAGHRLAAPRPGPHRRSMPIRPPAPTTAFWTPDCSPAWSAWTTRAGARPPWSTFSSPAT
jgi:outer membrane receptor protein involved in Fe transport